MNQNPIDSSEIRTKRKSRKDDFPIREQKPHHYEESYLPPHLQQRVYSPPFYSNNKRISSAMRLRGSESRLNAGSVTEYQINHSSKSNSLPRRSKSPLPDSRHHNRRSPPMKRNHSHPKKHRSSSVSFSKISTETSETQLVNSNIVRRHHRRRSTSSIDSSIKANDAEDECENPLEKIEDKCSKKTKEISSLVHEKKTSSPSSLKSLPNAQLNLQGLSGTSSTTSNKTTSPQREKRQRSGATCERPLTCDTPCCAQSSNSPVLVAELLRKAMQDRKIIDCDRWFGKRSICQPTVKSWVACLGYLIGDCVANGPYTEIYAADDALGRNGKVTVKTLRLAPLICHGLDRCFIRDQMLRWAKLRHPNVVTLYDGLVGQKKAIYIMEQACCCDLYHQLLEEEEWKCLLPLMARKWTWQITLGLAYLHEQNIPHQDLKLENILLFCNRDAKISDIGLARIYRDPCRPRKCCRLYVGTNAYIAPEILKGGSSCSMRADMWSFGIILFALWNRCLPYPTDLCDEELANIQCQQQLIYRTENCGCIEEMAACLIKSLLVPEPCMRPTAAQVKENPLFGRIDKKRSDSS